MSLSLVSTAFLMLNKLKANLNSGFTPQPQSSPITKGMGLPSSIKQQEQVEQPNSVSTPTGPTAEALSDAPPSPPTPSRIDA